MVTEQLSNNRVKVESKSLAQDPTLHWHQDNVPGTCFQSRETGDEGKEKTLGWTEFAYKSTRFKVEVINMPPNGKM